VTIRRAGEGDLSALGGLWDRFTEEATFTPYAPAGFDPAFVRDHHALVAEEDGRIVGTVYANVGNPAFGYVFGLYVAPEQRRRRVGTQLLAEVARELEQRGVRHVVLDVDTPNQDARALYRRLGFTEVGRRLTTDVAGFLGRVAGDKPPSFGSIHVQTDDEPAVERAVRQFVPRLPGRSRGSVLSPPRNGWVAVYDDVCDRDPAMLRRLARELSHRLGVVVVALGVEEGAVVRLLLFDRGGVVDEYLSVQEYYGPLPPGDVIALAANPTVIARMTGAQPAAVRAAAVHASSPAELPPAEEVLAGLATAIGIEGSEHGWEEARGLAGGVAIERG
jgi:ribosomal protein S18 acetylase RimI-like enzyme